METMLAADGLSLVADLIREAKSAGADAADALFVAGTSLSASIRLGSTEHVERAEGRDLGLRVFVGRRAAIVSASTIDPAGFRQLAERAVQMARVVPEDPHGGLADEARVLEGLESLDLDDADEPDVAALSARAMAAENAARSVHGVTNSDGAEAGFGRTEIVLVTSAGFAGTYVRTSHSVSAVALAGSGTGMQRDYDYATSVHLGDLESPEQIGHSAGERAVTRLNPTRPRTGRMPVVLDPRVASSIVGHLAAAVNGASVARKTTFLRDSMGQRLFGAGIRVVDDPRRRRGLRSRPFDGEGVPTKPLAIIDDGVLTSWVLDSRSARQLGLSTTGHAGRGTSGPPSPGTTNLVLEAGSMTPADLMADIKEGVYLTELMGTGVNGVTGDYSRGAAGFMIRDGAIAEPIAELTIAGTLQEIFRHLVPANDLRLRRGTDSPTVRLPDMIVGGA